MHHKKKYHCQVHMAGWMMFGADKKTNLFFFLCCIVAGGIVFTGCQVVPFFEIDIFEEIFKNLAQMSTPIQEWEFRCVKVKSQGHCDIKQNQSPVLEDVSLLYYSVNNVIAE